MHKKNIRKNVKIVNVKLGEILMDKIKNNKSFFKIKKLNKLGLIVLAGASVILSGCSNTKQHVKAPNVMLHTIDLQIDAASQSAASSLDQLAAIEKNQHPAAVKMPFMDIDSPELREYLSVKFYGPIKPLITNIAMGYSLQIYGKEPTIPIIVKINTVGNVETAKQILQNIDLQAGTSARLSIIPQKRLISMRYFDHAPSI